MIAIAPKSGSLETDHLPSENQGQASAGGADLDPMDLLHGLRRRGLAGAIVGAPLAIVVAVAVFMSQVPTYRASSLLRLSSQENSLVFGESEGTEFEIFQGTQKELVRTRLVMTAALRNMQDSSVLRMERPIDWMARNVRVDTPANTEIMTISTVASKDANPVEIVNATVDAYLVEVVNRERDTRQRRLAGIEAVFNEKQAESRRKRNELKRLADQLGTGDEKTLSMRQQLLVQELSFVRTQQIELQANRWTIDAELRSLEVASKGNDIDLEQENIMPTEAEIDAAIARDSIYNSLVRDKVTTFRLQADADSAFKSEVGSPFERVQSQIATEMKERRGQIEQELLAFAPLRYKARETIRKQQIADRINQINAEIRVLDQLKETLAADEARLMSEFKSVGNQSIDVEMMRGEIEQVDAVLQSIAKQREELKVELQSRPRVEVLRKAEEMDPADVTKRAVLAGASGVMSLFVPLTVLLLVDLLGGKVNSSTSLSSKTGLDVLGTVPIIPNGVLRRINDTKDKRSRIWQLRLNESVKRISSRLSHPTLPESTDGTQIYMVTSAVRGEGKTTLASQLATHLAHRTRRVILCDFDLRRPGLHRIYQADSSVGICEVLRGDLALADAIRETKTEGLSVLTSGDCCPSAIKALVEDKAEPLLKELRSLADVIVIDTSPVLSSADIGYLCPHVDQIIFAVRRDFSRTANMKKALQVLPALSHQVSGAVVTEKCSNPVDDAIFTSKP
ncbi:Tyrosine-protein kinase YwqD [Stieleria neptunia]|uniref:Tyrosine-protein kinase YwqD n=1 Tax=Stieleria neptunia TaxID=2527979 RepID=A0A518HNC3_9BACT|nr:polysaccharide biosynthesis tyrosine autokinase [Stieleria neptunia]QDV42309.1 Tyrosine-protein kinase YwqD [Stieleria neptunia]